MKPMYLKLVRLTEGGISVKSWISDPSDPSAGFEGMELYRSKDESSLAQYLEQLRQEGYEVKVVEEQTLEPALRKIVEEASARAKG